MGLSQRDKRIVFVLLSGSLLVVLNLTLLSPALPTIMQELSIGATTVQWLTSGYSLVQAIFIPLSAWFIGRFKTRPLFIGGILFFMGGSILAGLAPIFPLLLLGRLLQAAASGIIMPMVMTLIMLIYPREKRGAAMGLVGLVMSFAPAIGPSVGGLLVDYVGWRFLFLITAILSLIIVICAALFLSNYKGVERSKFDVPSVILSSLGLAGFLYGVSSIASSSNIVIPLVCMAIGLVLIAVFVKRQFSLETPLLKLDVLKSRQYRTSVLAVVILRSALIGTGVIFPLYIQDVLGHTATTTGLVMLPGALLGAISGMVAGRLFDRFGVRVLAIVGASLIMISGVGLIFFQIDSSIFFVLAVYTVLGLSIQLLITPVTTWGVNALSNNVIQHANAVMNTLQQVGGSLGTALIVSCSALSFALMPNAPMLEQTFTGYHFSFIASAALLFISFSIAILGVRDRKGDVARQKSLAPDITGERTVRNTMNPNSIVVQETAHVNEVIHAFAGADTSGAPIVNSSNKVVGFISTGDIMKYLGDIEVPLSERNSVTGIFSYIDDDDFMSRVSGLLELKVMDIATKKVITVDPDTSLEKVCTMLANRRIKKLPVVEDDKLIGVISRKNVVNMLSGTIPAIPAGKEN